MPAIPSHSVRVAFAFLSLVVGSGALLAAEPAKSKKVIEWGWDQPDTKFMRENIEQMEMSPFDGVVFHANSDKGVALYSETFGGPQRKLEEFQQAIDDLKATKFRRFTDRFLRINVTPGTFDWFDDKEWSGVLNNCAVAAQVARQGGCKGFMLDTEQYDGVVLFDYGKQKHHDAKSFADYQAKVRERGREWITAVNRHFPDIAIMLTFGYRTAHYRGKADPSQEDYALLTDFLDGVLDACADETRIVDAWEFSYGYKRPDQYQLAYRTITEKALAWTKTPQRYRRFMQAGFGIWLDNSQQAGWNVDDFSKNYFTPAEFEAALRPALQTSDEYVWIYSEQPRWWSKEKTSVKLPQAYVDAFRRAREPASAQPGQKK